MLLFPFVTNGGHSPHSCLGRYVNTVKVGRWIKICVTSRVTCTHPALVVLSHRSLTSRYWIHFQTGGPYGMGVWYKKPSRGMVNERSRPFVAEINNKKIGSFAIPEEAHAAWQKEKIKHLTDTAKRYKGVVDNKVIVGIMSRVEILREHLKKGIITNSISKMEVL